MTNQIPTSVEELMVAASSGRTPYKLACKVAASVSLTLSGEQTVDGVACVEGDRVLATAQADAKLNGPWVVSSAAWTRPADFNSERTAVLGSTMLAMLGTNAGEWRMTTPTSGVVRPGITAIAWARPMPLANPIALGLSPSGDPSGATDGAAWEAALATGRPIECVPGSEFYTDRRLDVPSGAIVRGNGSSLTAGTAFTNTAADDRTGSMLRVASAVGAVSTTLGATAVMGSRSLTVVSATGISAGMYLRLQGDNSAALFYGQSDAEVVSEILQVDSSYVSGTTIPLSSATCFHHATGKAVASLEINHKTAISDLYLDGSPKLVAVGIESTNALDLKLVDIHGRGFSRAIIDTYGCKGGKRERIVSYGDCNAIIHDSSSHHIATTRVRATGEYGRVHTLGIPRPAITIDDQCVGLSFREVALLKVAACFRAWGGFQSGVDGMTAHDVDPAEIVARDPEIGTHGAGIMGSVFDGGPARLAIATFGWGCYFRSVHASAVVQLDATTQAAIYYHDHYNMSLDNVIVLNKGGSPLSAGSYLAGIILSDADGTMNNHQVIGANHGLKTRNYYNRMIINSLYIDMRSGAGSSGSGAMVVDNKGGANTSPIIYGMRVANASLLVYFNTEWASVPDRAFEIASLHNDGYIASKVKAVPATGTLTAGKVLRIAAGSAAPEAVGPHHSNVIAMDAATNGWTLAAFADAVIQHTGTAAALGDLLEANAANQVVVNNSPASAFTARWRACAPSAGGFVNAQRI